MYPTMPKFSAYVSVIMLGPDLGQEHDRIICQRVLDAEGPKIESTFC